MAKSHTTSHSTITGYADLEDVRVRKQQEVKPPRPLPGPEAGEEAKWPAWKVTLFVLAFCGAFWGGVIWLGVRLLGG